MAFLTEQINPKVSPLKRSLVKKHYERKHGKNAYYGQNRTFINKKEELIMTLPLIEVPKGLETAAFILGENILDSVPA